MCGRYTMFSPDEKVRARFHADMPQESPALQPRYNITPMQSVLTLTSELPRRFRMMQWGLIPAWAKDDSMSAKMINARAETILEKPSFKNAFMQSRCLVIANGFYEWEKKSGQPYYVSLRDGECFAMAGLWEAWKNPATQAIVHSCTVITTTPNTLIAPYHHRMAVILHEADEEGWLDHATPQSDLLDLLRPYPAEQMKIRPVSKQVNSIRNDSPDLILPTDIQSSIRHAHSIVDDLQLF
jgi:putative SOS response-associated peptidase YedK